MKINRDVYLILKSWIDFSSILRNYLAVITVRSAVCSVRNNVRSLVASKRSTKISVPFCCRSGARQLS